MKFILLLFFAPIVLSEQLIGGNHCTWGPSYWCQHIDSAKECGAVDHCVNNDWKNKKVGELEVIKGNANCGYCQILVMEVSSLIKNQKAEKEISKILNESCDELKHKDMAPMCKKLANEYLHEVIAMLNKEMEPEKICLFLKFCKEKSHKSSELYKTFDAKPLNRVGDIKVPVKVGETICDECHSFITYVKAMVSSNGTEALVEEYLKQLVCGKLPSELTAVCKELVLEMVPKVVAMIESDLSSNDICKMIGVCSTKSMKNLRKTRTALYHLHVHKASLKGIECDYCEQVITQIRSFIANKDDQQEVEEFVKSTLCAHLGNFAAQCKTYVDEFMPEILSLINSELDPKSVCTALGACSSKVNKLAKKVTLTHNVKVTPSCAVCETVMAYLESFVKKNATEQDIIRVLDRICSFLPAKDKNECDALVEQYTPLIIQLLAAELKPSEICAVLHICTSVKTEKTITPKVAHLLGANPCTWGPSYWCKSVKHALSCGSGAHKHCRERVWNSDNLKFNPNRL